MYKDEKSEILSIDGVYSEEKYKGLKQMVSPELEDGLFSSFRI